MSAESQSVYSRPFGRVVGAVMLFRATRDDLLSLDRRHLAVGLILTWAMGAGRNWGNTDIAPIYSLGFGWLVYLLTFAVLIWLVLKPLAPPSFAFPSFLAFMALTMPLALVYVIPLEIVFDLGTIEDLDVRPLTLIAVWPVALTLYYARRALALDWGHAVVVVLLPFCLVMALSAAISAMPGLVAIMAESIMVVLFGKAVNEAVIDEAMVGYIMWQAILQLALAAFASLLVAYGVLVYRHRKGLRAR